MILIGDNARVLPVVEVVVAKSNLTERTTVRDDIGNKGSITSFVGSIFSCKPSAEHPFASEVGSRVTIEAAFIIRFTNWTFCYIQKLFHHTGQRNTIIVESNNQLLLTEVVNS